MKAWLKILYTHTHTHIIIYNKTLTIHNEGGTLWDFIHSFTNIRPRIVKIQVSEKQNTCTCKLIHICISGQVKIIKRVKLYPIFYPGDIRYRRAKCLTCHVWDLTEYTKRWCCDYWNICVNEYENNNRKYTWLILL